MKKNSGLGLKFKFFVVLFLPILSGWIVSNIIADQQYSKGKIADVSIRFEYQLYGIICGLILGVILLCLFIKHGLGVKK